MIKYNVKTVNDWLYNSNPIKKLYYNGMVRYRRFVANGQPTPPTPPAFDGKWKATYQDGHVESAQCDSSSAISKNEINKTNLVSVEIGDCVTTIGNSAFYNCTGLTNIVIPNSVTSIGGSAFDRCSGFTSITVEAVTPPTLNGSYVFSSTNNCPIYVPNESVDSYKAANRWSEYASRIKPISEKPQ